MKILVLGGSGFLSGYFARHALDAGHQLLCITRGQRSLDPRVTEVLQMDRQAIPEALAEQKDYDVVVDFIGMNAIHARQTVSLARRCQRLVFISSDYAYHPSYRKLYMKEDEAVFSDFPDYGRAKRQAEEVLLHAETTDSIRSIILRPPHIYGPGSWPGTIPKHGRRPTLLEDIRRGEPLTLLGGGLGLIQPIHADDLARIILALIAQDAAYGEQFTAVGPDLMTHLDYYQTLADLLDKALHVRPYCPDGPADDVNNYVAGHRCYDRSKLEGFLGNFNYTPFRQAMAAWIKALDAGV